MAKVLLDTDTLSEILKQRNSAVVAQAAAYLQRESRFSFSALTRYESLRGLKDKGVTTQLAQFETFCLQSEILPITDAILNLASDLWAAARRGGHAKSDADLIIAATALVHGYDLATGNTIHYSWISGLTIVNWRH